MEVPAHQSFVLSRSLFVISEEAVFQAKSGVFTSVKLWFVTDRSRCGTEDKSRREYPAERPQVCQGCSRMSGVGGRARSKSVQAVWGSKHARKTLFRCVVATASCFVATASVDTVKCLGNLCPLCSVANCCFKGDLAVLKYYGQHLRHTLDDSRSVDRLITIA